MTERQKVRALKAIQKKLKKLLASMRQTDASEINVKDMISFFEDLNEPLESEPLKECIEDLQAVDEFVHVHESDVEDLEAIEEEVADLIEAIEGKEADDEDEDDPEDGT